MRRKLLAFGAAATVLVFAACRQPIDSVGIDGQRPGRPGNMTVTASADDNWAIVSWTAGANSAEHEIVKRQGTSNAISVSQWETRQGGTFLWEDDAPVFTAGDNTDQFTAVISLFGLDGDFTVGVRSFPFDSVSSTVAPSEVTWNTATTPFRAFVPVEEIVFPGFVARTAGTEIDLNALATVYPQNATFQNIEWTVRVSLSGTSAGPWHVFDVQDGKFTPPFASMFQVDGARIPHGTNMGQSDFFVPGQVSGTINVTGNNFVRVTGIQFMDGPSQAEPGDVFDLNDFVNVLPGDANFQDIEWRLEIQGANWVDTGAAIPGGILTIPSNLGPESTLRLRAIIPNGNFWAGPEWNSGSAWNAAFTSTSASFQVTDPDFVPVTAVTIPADTVFEVGTAVDLNALAVVSPANASNQTIEWSRQEWSWSPISDGIWTPAMTGTVQLSATISRGGPGGAAYSRTFTVQVRAAQTAPDFVAVTDVILPATISPGAQIDLNAHAAVIPTNAVNQTIQWTVQVMDGTNTWFTIDAPNGVFPLPAHVNRLRVGGSIANGTGPGQNFSFSNRDVYITPPGFVSVTGITGIPTTGTTGTVNLDAAVAIEPANATNQTIQWEFRWDAWSGAINIPDGTAWTPPSTGTLQIRAIVRNGWLPGRDFVSDWTNITISVNDGFVSVSSVTTPVSITAAAGTQIDLNAGTGVLPANATNQTIRWQNIQVRFWNSNTGAFRSVFVNAPDGVFPLSAGFPWEYAAYIQATVSVQDGWAPGSNFNGGTRTIRILPPGFVPVTSVAVTAPVSVVVGTPVNLNTTALATVLPTNASNQVVRWEVRQGLLGTVTQIPDGIWTPAATGTFWVRAVVQSGVSPGFDFESDWTSLTVTLSPPVPLSENVWVAGAITTSGGENWFSFDVTAGNTYRLWWNDSHQGDGSKTLDTGVSIFMPDGTSHIHQDSRWTNAFVLTPTQSGTVEIRVTAWNAGFTGTFGIVYSTGTTRP